MHPRYISQLNTKLLTLIKYTKPIVDMTDRQTTLFHNTSRLYKNNFADQDLNIIIICKNNMDILQNHLYTVFYTLSNTINDNKSFIIINITTTFRLLTIYYLKSHILQCVFIIIQQIKTMVNSLELYHFFLDMNKIFEMRFKNLFC